jgi:flagellar hook-associated protein 2
LGYAYRLNQLANRLLGSGGPIASRNSGINESIDDINARREVLNRRIAAAEVRYRAQFSALDTLMGQLRSTSDFLTRQLAILPSAKG